MCAPGHYRSLGYAMSNRRAPDVKDKPWAEVKKVQAKALKWEYFRLQNSLKPGTTNALISRSRPATGTSPGSRGDRCAKGSCCPGPPCCS
ncbi:hypothetical protein DFAR_1340040 [Desulfarculales bacterium]